MLVVGSPMCKAFCSWQSLNEARSKDPEVYRRARAQAELHMDFVCELYREQALAGRYFLHEHPLGASSWKLECIQKVAEMAGVHLVHGDQCQYGASSGGAPVKKPTRFMTNSTCLAEALSKTCQGRGGACVKKNGEYVGRHKPCEGRVAAEA